MMKCIPAGLLLFFLLGSCNNNEGDKSKADSTVDTSRVTSVSTLLNVPPGRNIDKIKSLIRSYLFEKNLESDEGEGELIMHITDTFRIETGFIVSFYEEDDYFGGQLNGVALMDDRDDLKDIYTFTADSAGKYSKLCSERFSLERDLKAFTLIYQVVYADERGLKYHDSVEDAYWKINGPRPNEDRFGIEDLPRQMQDTSTMIRDFSVVNGKFRIETE